MTCFVYFRFSTFKQISYFYSGDYGMDCVQLGDYFLLCNLRKDHDNLRTVARRSQIFWVHKLTNFLSFNGWFSILDLHPTVFPGQGGFLLQLGSPDIHHACTAVSGYIRGMRGTTPRWILRL